MTLNLATADLFHAEIARLQAEIARLRSQPCPYVTGDTTRYCTLTPLTLTDEEREALKFVVSEGHVACQFECDIQRGLLERTAL